MKRKLLDWFWPWGQLAAARREAIEYQHQAREIRIRANREVEYLGAYNKRLLEHLARTMPAPVVKLSRCACATVTVKEAIMPSCDIPPGKFDPSLYPQSNPGL